MFDILQSNFTDFRKIKCLVGIIEKFFFIIFYYIFLNIFIEQVFRASHRSLNRAFSGSRRVLMQLPKISTSYCTINETFRYSLA